MTAGRWSEDERGSMTLWMVGLVMLVLAVGGISVDLWRAQAERRSLAWIADAAAHAGASGIDTREFRASGVLELDPAVAERLAHADLATQPAAGRVLDVAIVASTSEIAVRLEGAVDLTLLGLLAPNHDPLPIRVTATAVPRVAR